MLYEYQTMMARLTALEVANTGLYDGASALAEALLMALRLQKTGRLFVCLKLCIPITRRFSIPWCQRISKRCLFIQQQGKWMKIAWHRR